MECHKYFGMTVNFILRYDRKMTCEFYPLKSILNLIPTWEQCVTRYSPPLGAWINRGRQREAITVYSFSARNSPLNACHSWRAWITIATDNMTTLNKIATNQLSQLVLRGKGLQLVLRLQLHIIIPHSQILLRKQFIDPLSTWYLLTNTRGTNDGGAPGGRKL